MFETQKSGQLTNSGEIGLNSRTLAIPKVGRDQVSMEHLQRVWHASRERLSFRILSFVPLFGTCVCSNGWNQISQICRVFTRLFTLNTLRYFLDSLVDMSHPLQIFYGNLNAYARYLFHIYFWKHQRWRYFEGLYSWPNNWREMIFRNVVRT